MSSLRTPLLLMAAILSGGLTPIALATSPAGAAPAQPCLPEAASDHQAAVQLARQCGKRIEVQSARTENAQVFAQPSGDFTLEQSVEPRWGRVPGGWAAIDTTLKPGTDGLVRPAVGALPVTFSGGGTGPLATLADQQGREVSISWPHGALPAPVLSGDSATYPEVLPGVDLKVTAKALGFSEVLIVKDQQSAAHPALKKVRFGLQAKGVSTSDSGGGLVAKDGAGKPVFTSATPLMWDSGTRPAPVSRTKAASASEFKEAQQERESRGPKQTPMPVSVSGGELTVVPDQAVLTDPATRYPVHIDPEWTGQVQDNAWTLVVSRSDTRNSKFWQGGGFMQNAADKGAAGVGRTCDTYPCNSEQYLIRSMFRMDIGFLAGRQVKGAKFIIEQRHSWTCNPASDAKVWLTGAIDGNTSWNAQPHWFGEWTASTAANRRSDGQAGCQGAGNIEFGVGHIVAHAVGSGWGNVTLGLAAHDEGTLNQWKRFRTNPVLSVDYNTIPNNPDQLQVDSKGCVAGGAKQYVSTATPTIRARASDNNDPDNHQVHFAWAKWNGSGYTDVGGTYRDSIPNWGYADITLPALAQGRYQFRVQSNDYRGGVSGLVYSCEFEVDLEDPAAPGIYADVYKTSGCAPEGCGSVGRTGKFTFQSSPDVAYYKWGWRDAPDTQVFPSATGGSVTVYWTPTLAEAGPRTLYVDAFDLAGRRARTIHQFTVRAPQPAVAQWLLNEAGGETVLDNAMSDSTSLNATLSGGTLGADGPIVGGDTALKLNGSGQYASVPYVFDTSRAFSVSAWARVTDTVNWGTSSGRAVVSQDGTVSMYNFKLQLAKGCGCWEFSMSQSDSGTTTRTVVLATGAGTPNLWTHLVGVHDPATAKIHLYVNGKLAGSAAAPSVPWRATGPLTIGRSKWNNPSEYFVGEIRDVRAWDRAITPAEITTMLGGQTKVAGYNFDGPCGPCADPAAYDSSGYGHDLSFTGGTSIPASGAGKVGVGALFDRTGHAQTGQVLRTSQSYTVTTWVRLDGTTLPTGNRTAISQSGTYVSGFYLGYRVFDGVPHWSFSMREADTDQGTSPFVHAKSATPISAADLGTWVKLTASYNGVTRELSLSVNDGPATTATKATPGWDANGQFLIGGAWFTQPGGTPGPADRWYGAIDEVLVTQGLPAS